LDSANVTHLLEFDSWVVFPDFSNNETRAFAPTEIAGLEAAQAYLKLQVFGLLHSIRDNDARCGPLLGPDILQLRDELCAVPVPLISLGASLAAWIVCAAGAKLLSCECCCCSRDKEQSYAPVPSAEPNAKPSVEASIQADRDKGELAVVK
jgi:hypothetical protein